MSADLIALRRIRNSRGVVVLPGNPVPGSAEWPDRVRALRISQGYVKEAPLPEAKPKAKKPAKKQAKKKG